jgi:hypothetical protein
MLNDDYDLLPSSPRLPTQSLQSGSQSMWQAAFFSVVGGAAMPSFEQLRKRKLMGYRNLSFNYPKIVWKFCLLSNFVFFTGFRIRIQEVTNDPQK